MKRLAFYEDYWQERVRMKGEEEREGGQSVRREEEGRGNDGRRGGGE